MSEIGGIDTAVSPSGNGCLECTESGGWWWHLRRCAKCGHVGCCDSSPSQHASRHYEQSGHEVVQSFEPGETWFWNFRTQQAFNGPMLAAPSHHPLDQPTPGPAGLVPADWEQRLR